MAFLTGFENDVFISYAHDDNEPDLLGVEWVGELVKLLKRALKQKLGARENLEIFWDGWKLQQNHQLDRLEKEVNASAVFVAICSPSYATGEWTKREIECFAKRAGINSNRLFAIEYLPLPAGMEHPLALQSHFVKPWHQPVSEAGARAPISPKENTSAYLAHLQDLAEQIKDQLIAMQQSGATAGTAEASPDTGLTTNGAAADVEGQQMKSVLLGMVGVGQDIQDQREDVRRYLEQYGIRVYPDCEKPYYPFEGTAFVEEVAEDLKKCDLFVQLIGDYPAMRLPPLEHDFATTQLLMAEAVEREGFEILQWRAPDLDLSAIKDDQHIALLTGNRVMGNLTLETFKATIVDHATIPPEEDEPEPEVAAAADGGDVPEIFVNANDDDDGLIDQIMTKLDDMGVNIYAPMNDDNAERIREELEEYYKTCDAIVVVYGEAEPRWVRSQVTMCNKLEHERKRKPRLKALLMAPPEAKANLRMRLSDWQEIDCRDGLDPERLKSMIAGLKR
ncbi:MAG: toll/interleukin-1 receptor domain-containing protein [Pseudomonadota bacterium]